MDDERINADVIARYFSSDNQARDYLAVIESVIPKDEPFYMIAQSYGGMVGMQYISLPHARKPKGVIFSCSALPHESMQDSMISRRREQLKLNLELREACPNIADQIADLRQHLKAVGLNPGLVNCFYTALGKGVKGVWEPTFAASLEKMKLQNREEIQKSLQDNFGTVNMLNYILSSANFTPGFTDRTIARLSSKEVPFESWMIDASPPPQTPFLGVESLKKAITGHQLLFTPADNDAYVPAEQYVRAIQKFLVPGHTQVKQLPGGHHAIFLADGQTALIDWARSTS